MSEYNTVYERMINSVDDVDSQANLRLRDGSNDKELMKAIDKAIVDYNTFLDTVHKLVVLTPEPATPPPSPPSSS